MRAGNFPTFPRLVTFAPSLGASMARPQGGRQHCYGNSTRQPISTDPSSVSNGAKKSTNSICWRDIHMMIPRNSVAGLQEAHDGSKQHLGAVCGLQFSSYSAQRKHSAMQPIHRREKLPLPSRKQSILLYNLCLHFYYVIYAHSVKNTRDVLHAYTFAQRHISIL